MFPYVAWIAGFHFAREVLSVRSQKEFRFKLREVQGLGNNIKTNVHILRQINVRDTEPEFSRSDGSHVAGKMAIRTTLAAVVIRLFQELGELPCSPRVASNGAGSLESWDE